ncbi:MAG TPA: tetratricopeptide repeat protein [Noviherbaspirillum sp.]|uniref:tetratricopeptide repeat protein n=1 Tax=Noviherbaspirillum sp. TaxID=1926288 RepID=UPI002B467D29|nr:tetratricopeptide repeat protein [Noviherbaspirillum sp.]HJV84304.1 tetratricopeptide repeat protein [Noviherbaspirillum sp.]
MMRMGRFILRIMLLSLLSMLFAGMAEAVGGAPFDGSKTLLAQQDLYMDAMHSIAEGRPDEASDALMRMIEQEPQHAGAWLDLAIIQCELGHAVEAERLFQIIEERFAPPPGIREVIAAHRAKGCKGWEARNQWSLALGRGVDSNVNQGASSPNFSIGSGSSRIDLQLAPEYLPQHDQYTLLAAEYSRDLAQDGSVGFVQLRSRVNDSLTRYNTTALRFGLEHPWRMGDWGLRTTGALGFLTLGNQLYQKQGQLQLRVAPPLSLPEHFRFNALTGLTRVQYDTLANYDSNTIEAGGILMYQDSKTRVEASAGYLTDRGAAARLGGNRSGWYAGIQGNVRLGHDMTGELGWSQQHWLSTTPYSPGLIDQIRRQDTQLLRAALIVPIKPQHSLQIEVRQVRNNENISIFQYNSQLLQVSWQWVGN